MPTLPALVTTRCVAVDEPTTNSGPDTPLGLTESNPQGVVVPIPTLPPYGWKIRLLAVAADCRTRLPEAEPML